jgi:hypothetical protein
VRIVAGLCGDIDDREALADDPLEPLDIESLAVGSEPPSTRSAV